MTMNLTFIRSILRASLFRQACISLLAWFALANMAAAQTYPSKAIMIINPWTPGGPADAVARPIMNKLSERLGQPIVVENRAGANGVIGSAAVARAAPDGYTLLFSHVGPIAISPAMKVGTPYNSVKDFEPITQVVSAPTVLLVRPDLPVKTLQELVAYAKSRPGKLTYGSVGPGSTTHLAGEMLHSLAGIDILHVPYKGAGPVLSDLVGGQIDMAFINIAGAMPFIKSGRLRGIAVSTLSRSTLMPDLPAIAETYPGFEVNSWYGVMAPAGTPKDIVTRLQKEIANILKLPDIVKVLETSGLDAVGSTPEQYAVQIKNDLARWATVVKAADLK
jgi:tripartite-type tricarboxylate transporter receptor subunit TctC